MRSWRMPAIGVFALTAILFIHDARAFFGNIGGLPCLVGCGGSRGVVNTNFFGDAVATFVTGPSIDRFESAGRSVVDYADQKLNASLERQFAALELALSKQKDDFVNS